MAAEKTGRRCNAMELTPAYIDVTVKRWQAFTGKQAIHEASGKTFDELKAEKP
jgi:DNA modification methylase